MATAWVIVVRQMSDPFDSPFFIFHSGLFHFDFKENHKNYNDYRNNGGANQRQR